jgi:uncharacterized DUF497 family protein
VSGIRFEWDEAKNLANLALDLPDLAQEGPTIIAQDNPERSEGAVLGEQMKRSISPVGAARTGTRKERRIYEDENR